MICPSSRWEPRLSHERDEHNEQNESNKRILWNELIVDELVDSLLVERNDRHDRDERSDGNEFV